MKPFDLEAFKAGQKALTRDGRVATFIGVCEECSELHQLIIHIERKKYTSALQESGTLFETALSAVDLVSMVSRHQALIDAYNPEDTWQFRESHYQQTWTTCIATPEWNEYHYYRIHPNNDLIKAFKSGKEIVATNTDGNEVPLDCLEDLLDPRKDWDDLRIKTEPEFEYPIYKQSKHSGVVVEFTNLETGRVLVGNNFYESDQVQITGIPHTDTSQWQDWTPLTKSKLTTHCLAYDASLDPNPKLWGPPVVSEKQFAIKKGWTIIKEWEV